MSENISLIPSRLKNAAVGGHVAGASDIIDDAKGQTQDVINAANDAKFSQMDDEIEALEKQDVVPVDSLPSYSEADPKKIYRVVGSTSYTDYMVNATGDGWKELAEFTFPGIDDVPTVGSDNLVKSSGTYGVNHSLSGAKAEVDVYTPYIRNIYILPKTQEKYAYLKSLSPKSIRVIYVGVRNSSLGGPSSIFGVQLWLANDNRGTYYINTTPDLSKSLIVNLNLSGGGGSGELNSGIDVYAEFNPRIDFSTPSGLLDQHVYVDILDTTQIPLFYESIKNGKDISSLTTSVNGKADKVNHNEVLQVTEYLKTAKIDYRSLMRIARFEGNLFDKTRVLTGYYAATAGYEAAENYSAAIVPVPLELGQTYIFKYKNTTHVQILKVEDLSAVKHITSGSTGWDETVVDDNILFTVPSDLGYDVCALVSVYNSNLDTAIFNKGTSLTLEPFTILFDNTKRRSDLVVDASGNGDYTTIAQAIANSEEGQKIYIKNGVYNESLKINSRRVHLIGESMDGTILCYGGMDYANPPLEIAKGFVENMTIMALNEGTVGSSRGYSAHIDAPNSKDEVLEFRNVKFISETYQVVGIGLYPNFKLSFINCWFISKNSYDAFYCHDCEESGYSDYSGQELLLDSCRFYTDSTWGTIRLQTQEKNVGVAKCTFVNNNVYGDNPRKIYMTFFRESIGGDNYLESSDWVLDKISAQNTVSKMNYQV